MHITQYVIRSIFDLSDDSSPAFRTNRIPNSLAKLPLIVVKTKSLHFQTGHNTMTTRY